MVHYCLMSLILNIVLLGQPSESVPKSYFYRFGEEAGDTRLPKEDEISSLEIGLRAPIIFYGQVYQSIFVNTNGFVSFWTEIPNFFNVKFPLEYPLIAPFYSDVDTRKSGTIWYRETSDPGTISRSKTEVNQHFRTAGDFNPTGVFIVTWDRVGPYNQRTDMVNTYQLVLVTDGEETYSLFHYADGGIQWLKGDGKNPSVPDARGQAGLVSGDGRFFELKGSGSDQVRNLDKWSNCGNAGVWMYRIGQLNVNENVQNPDVTSQMIDEIQSCAVGGPLCHSDAICTDYTPGFCCSCEEDYLGNGINCIPKGEPMRVTGKVSGNLNGVKLTDLDLHSYVLTSEGRSYTALSRVPSQIGYDLQSITAIGTGIAWLFAVPVNNVKNGFQTTGGNMNRSVEVDFPQTGHRIEVQQQFEGLDVFNYVQVKTLITGSIPTIAVGSKIEMNAFNEEYTRVKPGQLRARSSRLFRLKGQSIDTPFTVETIIDYDECQWKDADEQETRRLKVSENIFIQYDGAEEIVRYALSAKLAPLEEIDPCVEGREECGENSQCVVDGETYRCICERGYEELYDATVNKKICLDLNECSTDRDNCHNNALCTNTPGSFICSCKPGFIGDGINCEKVGTCEGIPCDPNAVCKLHNEKPQCMCRPGFTGDGLVCRKEIQSSSVNQQRTCLDYSICSTYANCIYDDLVRSFRCLCLPGYVGDGQTCLPAHSCIAARNCSPHAQCTKVENEYRCECLAGFSGDGYICEEVDTLLHTNETHEPQDPYHPQETQQPYQPMNPFRLNESVVPSQPYYSLEPYQPQEHEVLVEPYQPLEYEYQEPYQPLAPDEPYQPDHPQQSWESDIIEPECINEVCWCPLNYKHNAQLNQCEQKQATSVEDVATEIPEPYCGAAKCTCPKGYYYDSIRHICVLLEEDYHGSALAHPLPECFTGRCYCPSGYYYEYSEHICLSNNDSGYNYNIQGGDQNQEVSCHDVNLCHPEAQCTHNSYTKSYSCECNAGYDGDGYTCTKIDVSCDQVDICHIHAKCVFDDQTLQHGCVCIKGYQGDGLVCTPQDECTSVADCDINAQCLYDSSTQRYKCVCNEDYIGDGHVCAPSVEPGCNIINDCDINADCIYDTYELGYRCQCHDGYEGDGIFCSPNEVSCNVLHNCGENAVCSYSLDAQGYRCICLEGFNGDGFFCTPARSCQLDPSICHPQAACVPDHLSPEFGYLCRCQAGFVGDGQNCQEAPSYEKDILIFNQGLAVLRMPVNLREGRSYIIHFDAFMTAVGADIDCLKGRYYWTDVRSSSIRSSNYDGTERQPLITQGNIGFPEDVAVDWISQNIYWTDSENDVVAVASIDDGKQRTVIKKGLVNPRGIAVHPGYRLLFWSDWNRLAPKIETSDLDGSKRNVLIQENILLPNSLVVDYETDALCWADAGTHKIECVGVQGSGRRVVTRGLQYPFGLTILGQNFFYTDWNDTKIHTVNRYSGVESPARAPPPGGSGKLYGISAVPSSCPSVSNMCALNNGGCPSTHLCLPNNKGGRMCACTDLAIQDEKYQCVEYGS